MESNNPLQQKILDRIHEGRLVMRPRYHFFLKAAALVLVAFLALVVSIFICNFLFFILRLNGHGSLLARPGGIILFLRFFPWELLVLDAALLVLLEWLLKQFKFGYKSPTLYLGAALLVVIMSAGFALDRGTTFNDRVLNRADHNGLPPPFVIFYEHAHRPLPPGFRPQSLEIFTRPAL